MKKLLFDILILSAVAFGVLWLLDSANAQTWDWSPRASHHAAACEVRSGDPERTIGNKQVYQGGSGVYISFGKLRGVLTAAHVMKGDNAVVTFSNGIGVTSRWTSDKFGHDVAFIFATHSSITPIPMSQQDPNIGDRVELVTYGGPASRQLRSFWAVVGSIGNKVTKYNCDVLDGDSGGAILNLKRELIGIEAHGYDKIETQKEWHAYRGADSANTKIIRDFLRRVAGTPGRNPGKCGPRGCPAPRSLPPLSPFYPPPGPAPAAPPSSEAPEIPSTPVSAEINYDLLATMILKQINPDDFRGPAGLAGSVGPTGLQGPIGVDGVPGVAGLQGPSGFYSDLTEEEMLDLARRIKKLINGSVRVKVEAVQ